jgi:hypothetical protein
MMTKNMNEEIEKDKLSAIEFLKRGFADNCADDIEHVILNAKDGACDYLELIPVLEKIAGEDFFDYWDDNGAGGQAHPDSRYRTSFRQQALKTIENIRENARFEANCEIAQALKSNSHPLIKKTLEDLGASQCRDKKLIPILEKIAKKEFYATYSNFSVVLDSYKDSPLDELAGKAIQKILENYEQHPDGTAFEKR